MQPFCTRVVAGAFMLLLWAAVPSEAQDSLAHSAPAEIAFEVGGFGGFSGGLGTLTDELAAEARTGLILGGLRNVQTDGGSPLKWLLGGHVAAGLGSQLLVTGEVLLNRLASPSFTASAAGQPVALTLDMRMSEFTAGFQFLLTPGRHAPYFGAAVGIVRFSAAVNASTLPSAISVGENDLTWNVGGGVRLNAGANWGLRPDLRVVRIPDATFYRATVGLFYQFR